MKNAKLWLIIAAVLMIIGVVLFVTAMNSFDWNFSQLNSAPYETNTYALSGDFHSIAMNADTADVSILPSKTKECQVVCHEPENLRHSVEILDGVLTITETDTRKWHQKVGFSFGNTEITVYLPETEYQELSIRQSTGDIEIPKDFTFRNINIKVSTGDIDNYASVLETMQIQTSTGHIRIENTSADTLDLLVSTGKVTVTDSQCTNLFSRGSTGDLTLKNVLVQNSILIERSTGDVIMNDADAKEIFIETSSGDVRGNLLTGKVFHTETNTGDIDVPKSVNGGSCEIHTDTGDIEITIKGHTK